MESFENIGLSENTLKVIRQRGFEEPTPIQIQAIPAILGGSKDIVGQAQTGTGKTAAFGLPMIELLEEKSRRKS
jgi:ATP-dependent RNA helicase DeaD